MFYKKKTYQIGIADANTTLQNVFAACNQTPNTVPIDRLLLRRTAKTKLFDVLLRVIGVLLVLTLLSPLLFLTYIPISDSSPITLQKSYVANDKLYLDLDIGKHTLKFEEAYLVSPSGTIYEIVSYDEQTHTLCFPNVAPDCCVYVPYDDNSLLRLQLDD